MDVWLDPSTCIRLALALGHFLWQGALVAAVAGLLVAVMRHATAKVRYGIWCAALLAMAACPVATFALLGGPSETATRAIAPTSSLPRTEARSVGSARPPQAPGPQRTGPLPVPTDVPQLVQTPSSPGLPTAAKLARVGLVHYAPYVTGAYLLGVGIMLARISLSLVGGGRLRRRSSPVADSAVLTALARGAQAIGLAVTPAIAYCGRVVVPTVVGVLRPTILLPLSFGSGLTPQQVEMLLTHELAHIRRYDHLVNLVQRLVEAGLFFHPAVWYISRHIRIEREHCCDDAVLALGGAACEYAASLVHLAEQGRQPATATSLSANGGPSPLGHRVSRLIDGPSHTPVRLARGWGLAIVPLLVVAVFASLTFVSGGQEGDDTAREPVVEAPSPAASDADASSSSNPSSIAVTGLVTDTEGNPLRDVAITALRASGSMTWGLGNGVTNTGGRYAIEIRNLGMGGGGGFNHPVDLAIVPSLDGWFERDRWEHASLRAGPLPSRPYGEEETGLPRVLGPRAEPYEIDFVMEPGVILAGRMHRPDGTPYSKPVHLGWERRFTRWDAFVAINPDEEGRFRCTAPVGDVWLTRGSGSPCGPVPLEAPGEYELDVIIDDNATPPTLSCTEVSEADVAKTDRPLSPIVAGTVTDPDGKLIEGAIQRLSSPDRVVRAQAAEMLGELGDRRAVEPLIGVLEDAAPTVWPVAARSLGQLGDLSAVVPLIKALADEHIGALSAARALATLNDPRAIGPLADALSHKEKQVRVGAMRALSTYQTPAALDAILQALENGEDYLESAALGALGKYDDARAWQWLDQTLASEDRGKRRLAAYALGGSPHGAAFASLLNAASDPEESVRKAALRMLVSKNDPRAVPAFRDALACPGQDDDIYQVALRGLGRLGDTSTVETVEPFLEHEDDSVRRVAGEAMADIRLGAFRTAREQGESDAVRVARAALTREDEGQRAAALRFLGQTKVDAALQLLLELADGPDTRLCAEAVAILGAFDDPRVTEALLNKLDDPDPETRWHATQILAQRGDTRAVEPLVAFATHESKRRRREVARLLREVPSARALDTLCALLNDPEDDVREDAASSLCRVADHRVLDALIEALADPRLGHERGMVAIALGRIGGPRAVASLEYALADEVLNVATHAANALARLGWEPPSEELRVRYLIAAKMAYDPGAAVPRAESTGANSLEGPFELGMPILTPLTVGTEDRPTVVWISRVEFNVREGELRAILYANYSSWPESRWLIHINLLDQEGSVLADADCEYHVPGISLGFHVSNIWMTPLPLSFGQVDALDQVTRFSICVTRLDESPDQDVQPNPSGMDEHGGPSTAKPAPAPASISETAVWLDGEHDYYEVTPHPALDLGHVFTIEAWICFAEGGTINPRILSKGWAERGGYELLTHSTSNLRTVGFLTTGLDRSQSERQIAADQWYHVAVVCDSVTVTLYINGEPAGQTPYTGIRPNRSPLTMGRNSETGRDYFRGKIGEIRLWSVTRSQRGIRADMTESATGNEPGLVACWQPQKGTKNVLTDIGPNHLDAYHGSQKGALKAAVVNSEGKPAGTIQMNPWRLVEGMVEDVEAKKDWSSEVRWVEAGAGRVWDNQSNTQTKDKCTFDQLPPGIYRVSAHTVHKGKRHDPTPFGFSDPVTIEPGNRSHEVTVQFMPGCQTDLRFADADTRAPVPHVEYIMTTADGFPVGYGSHNFHQRTGEDGTVRFSSLPQGKYTLLAQKSPARPEDPSYSLGTSPMAFEVHEDGQRIEIAMTGSKLTQEEVENRWPFSVFGTVTDEHGNPVPGVDLWANCGMGTLLQTGSTESREDGTYTLRFRPGMHVRNDETGKWGVGHQAASIFAAKEGYYERNLCRQGGLTMAGERPGADNAWGTNSDQVVLPDQPYRLDFVMVPAARIEGRLVDPEGQPLPERRVMLTGRELPPSSSVIKSCDTDAEGRFTTGALPCKSFWFEVRKDRDDIKSVPFHLTVPGDYEVTLTYDAGQRPTLTYVFDAVPPAATPEDMVAQARTKPDLSDTLFANVFELGYVDDTAEGKKSLGASGHGVRFQRPGDANYIEAVQIYASRYGTPQPPDDNFHLYVMDDTCRVLADVPFAYGLVERGDMRWYTFRTPSIEVPKQFHIGLAFNPHQTKGVFLGFDESVAKSHSFTGLPGDGYEPVDGNYDWMVRAYVAKEPSGEKGIHRLADWSPPVHIDAFEGCLEVKYDDGESDGKQSYGGRGPAVRIDLANFMPRLGGRTFRSKRLALRGVRVYGSRYGSGYDLETSTIAVTVLDAAGEILATEHVPYSRFSYTAKWVDLVFDKPLPITGPDPTKLTIALDPEAHRTKGIFFHYNEDPPQSHSLVGTVEKGFEHLPEREWTIRAYFQAG